jgi:hypothetical protein
VKVLGVLSMTAGEACSSVSSTLATRSARATAERPKSKARQTFTIFTGLHFLTRQMLSMVFGTNRLFPSFSRRKHLDRSQTGEMRRRRAAGRSGGRELEMTIA